MRGSTLWGIRTSFARRQLSIDVCVNHNALSQMHYRTSRPKDRFQRLFIGWETLCPTQKCSALCNTWGALCKIKVPHITKESSVQIYTPGHMARLPWPTTIVRISNINHVPMLGIRYYYPIECVVRMTWTSSTTYAI